MELGVVREKMMVEPLEPRPARRKRGEEPPGSAPASSTVTEAPDSASRYAAVSPVAPAPITMTCFADGSVMGWLHGWDREQMGRASERHRWCRASRSSRESPTAGAL